MRTIKFRAWDGEAKSMVVSAVGIATIVTHILRDGRPTPTGFGSRAEEVSPDKYELMQFTSLLDKNGKEIYEGDIIRTTGSGINKTVTWNERMACFGFGDGSYFNELHRATSIEVIGNIYENPELITV